MDDECTCDDAENQIGREGGFRPRQCGHCADLEEDYRNEARFEQERDDRLWDDQDDDDGW